MSALPLAPLDAFLKDLGLSLSDEQADMLARFYELVSAANCRFNLTAVTDAESFVTKHYIDSVSSADIFPAGAKILDLGAGAGLPSVPLAIVRPDIFVTALDATAKKVGFISSSARALKLKNLTATAGRAEERGDLFSKFDLLLSLRSLNSLCLFSKPAAGWWRIRLPPTIRKTPRTRFRCWAADLTFCGITPSPAARASGGFSSSKNSRRPLADIRENGASSKTDLFDIRISKGLSSKTAKKNRVSAVFRLSFFLLTVFR